MNDDRKASAERRYRAFVSYSHADAEAGAKLFRKLDGYRIPARLQKRMTARGMAPDTLYPCFRDREELGADRDVTTRLDDALGLSDALVVVCSPAAAASKWVNYEIEAFVKLGRADRIHAVIIEGEPEHAFPPALSTALGSPLAADLRREGDGWHNGFLKLVAGLTGLPFGELRDRELERAHGRQRLAAAIASGFAMLAAGALVATWYAVTNAARVDASLTALDGVATRLVSDRYGEGIEASNGAAGGLAVEQLAELPRFLEIRAKLMIFETRLRLDAGDFDAAKAVAGVAISDLDNLRTHGRYGPDLQRMHGTALRLAGDAALRTGDKAGARELLEQSRRIREALVAEGDADGVWRRELAETLLVLADASDAAVSDKKALLERSLKMLQAIELPAASDRDEIDFDLSLVHERLADIALEAKMFEEAAPHVAAMIATLQALVNQRPDVARFRRSMAAARQREVTLGFASVGSATALSREEREQAFEALLMQANGPEVFGAESNDMRRTLMFAYIDLAGAASNPCRGLKAWLNARTLTEWLARSPSEEVRDMTAVMAAVNGAIGDTARETPDLAGCLAG